MKRLPNFERKFFSEKTLSFVFLSILALFAVIMCIGSKNGIGSPDESFYLTIPYRVLKGDALYLDEWHASQNSAFLLWLPMLVFTKITGSADGVVLFFRVLYCVCQTIISGFIFLCLKKEYGNLPAFASAVLFMLYAPETLGTLDYYTMSMMGYAVVTFLLLFAPKKTSVLFLVGVVVACTVTAMPLNSLAYFVWTASVVVNLVLKKKMETNILSLGTWLRTSGGVVFTAFGFIAWLLMNATPAEILGNFMKIFSGNDHTLPGSDGGSDMFTWGVVIKTLFDASPVFLILSAVLLLLVICDRERIKRRKIYAIVSGLFCACYALVLLTVSGVLFWPYPVFVLTAVLYILLEKKDKRLRWTILSGLIYVLLLGIVSQALDYVGAFGFVLSGCALFPCAGLLIKEIKSEQTEKHVFSKISVIVSVVSCFCIFAVALGYGGYSYLSPDSMAIGFGRDAKTSTTLKSGPLKGIKVSAAQSKDYYALLSDMKTINESGKGKTFIIELIPWCYLALDKTPATDTTWFLFEENVLLEEYYENPSHYPECMYIPDTDFYYGKKSFYGGIGRKQAAERFVSAFSHEDVIHGSAGDIYYIITPSAE